MIFSKTRYRLYIPQCVLQKKRKQIVYQLTEYDECAASMVGMSIYRQHTIVRVDSSFSTYFSFYYVDSAA